MPDSFGRYEAKAFVPTTAGTIKRVSVYGKTRKECHAKYVKLKARPTTVSRSPSRDKPRCCALKGGECYNSRLSVRMVKFVLAVPRNAL